MHHLSHNIVVVLLTLFIASVCNMTDAMAVSAPKEELTSQQVAVKFFDKQAKLKAVKPTEDDYYESLHLKKDVKKGLWGYVDDKDKWAIRPVFAEAEEFGEDHCAMVKLEGYWGMIDRSRSFVIVPINRSIQRTSVAGVYVATCPMPLWEEYRTQAYNKKREDWLKLIDTGSRDVNIAWRKDGSLFHEDVFESVQDFDANNIAIVSTEAGYGMLSSEGSYVITPRYQALCHYGNDLYRVTEGGRYGLVNSKGIKVLATDYDIIEPWDAEALAWIRFALSQKWNAIDTRGSICLLTNLDAKPVWNEWGRAVVTADGKYGIIDKLGNFEIACTDEYIEAETSLDYWTVRANGHIGKYRLKGARTEFVGMPAFDCAITDKRQLLNAYRQRYADSMDDRLWMKNLHESAFYSPYYQDETGQLRFRVHGHDYELQTVWEDTVRFVLRALDFGLTYRLPVDRRVGCLDVDQHGRRAELYTNEYVMGTYDIDDDGTDELIIALRDNSTPGWLKPSGGCYTVFRISSDGQCSIVKSELLSTEAVMRASFSDRKIAVTPLDPPISNRVPCAENFGLKGPVMTTGEYSFDEHGRLTRIDGHNFRYNADGEVIWASHGWDEGTETSGNRIVQFNQNSIVIEFPVDCDGDGVGELNAESWTFNSQGLLETAQPFACTGGCQYYYVYDPTGMPRYRVEARVYSTVARYLPETAVYDAFGNWISMDVLEYSDEGVSQTRVERNIEYYTESETGK